MGFTDLIQEKKVKIKLWVGLTQVWSDYLLPGRSTRMNTLREQHLETNLKKLWKKNKNRKIIENWEKKLAKKKVDKKV